MGDRRLTESAWMWLLTLGSAAVLGYVVATRPSLAAIAAAAMIGGLLALRSDSRPVLMGLLVLAYLNALPFFDLVEIRLPAGFRFDDVAMAGVLIIGVVMTWRAPWSSPLGRLKLLLGLIVVYWMVVLAITVLSGGGSFVMSALYGRDFLAIAMSLGIAATTTNRRDSERLIVILLAGACLYAGAHLLQFTLGADTSFITHPFKVGEAVGATRIFSKAMALIIPMFMLSLGRALITTAAVQRIWYSLAAGLLAVEILIEFTRANYVGMIVVFAAGAVMVLRAHTDSPRSRAAIILVGASVTAGAAWIASGLASVQSWLRQSSVTLRFTSASVDVASQGGTFGYRLGLYRTTFGIVGGQWLTGVGFWHPAEHYVALLPEGSIRNNDTGLLGVFATMGIIGVILILAPAFLAFRWGVRALRSTVPWIRATGWSAVGYLIWVTFTSFSLGYFSYGAGLAATSIIIGVMTGCETAIREGAEASVGES